MNGVAGPLLLAGVGGIPAGPYSSLTQPEVGMGKVIKRARRRGGDGSLFLLFGSVGAGTWSWPHPGAAVLTGVPDSIRDKRATGDATHPELHSQFCLAL